MQHQTPTLWDANGNLEVLIFDLGEESFALEAALVREIVDLVPETRVPGAPKLVGGVANFRGKIIPIADLRLAFDMTATQATIDSRIVVIELALDGEPIPIGIRTDKVYEVATLNRNESEPPPAVGLRWRREYVREIVRRAEGVVVLPDLPMIFHLLTGGHDAASSHPSLLN